MQLLCLSIQTTKATFFIQHCVHIRFISLCFLLVYSSTEYSIFQRSPVEWRTEWTSDPLLVNSIVYSPGSGCVQLFNMVPRSYRVVCAGICSCSLLITSDLEKSFCDEGILNTLLRLKMSGCERSFSIHMFEFEIHQYKMHCYLRLEIDLDFTIFSLVPLPGIICCGEQTAAFNVRRPVAMFRADICGVIHVSLTCAAAVISEWRKRTAGRESQKGQEDGTSLDNMSDHGDVLPPWDFGKS